MVPRPPDVIVLVVLGLPHLVLADVGHDERPALGDAPQIVHHVGGEEPPGGRRESLDVPHRGVSLELVDARDPRLAVALGHAGDEALQGFRHVPDEGEVGAHDLVHLGRIELAVDLAGARRVRLELPGHPVVEAHP
jgi:hypothetical protein